MTALLAATVPTIMFVDQEWSHDWSQRSFLSEGVLRQFEKETGIKVNTCPLPKTSEGQLKLIQELLAEKDTPDVFGIDIVWSGLLDDGLLDLKPFFSAELAAARP